MTSYDLPAFTEVFDGMARVLFARRMDDGERGQMLSAYFKALRGYRIEAVKVAAETILATHKHFPKPVEWVDALPRVESRPDVPTMPEDEARDWRDAESRYWEADPCGCDACVAANVHWKPLRFVPEFDSWDNERKALDGSRGRVVTRGHWAHGQELARWYASRGAFTSMAETLRKAGRIPTLVGVV